MVRQKRAAQVLKTEAPRIYHALQQAYKDGLLLERQFDYLLERLVHAEAKSDGIYAHNSPYQRHSSIQSMQSEKSNPTSRLCCQRDPYRQSGARWKD